MMKEKIKNVKGISLISLTITIIVLVILTNIIIYNVKDNLQVGKLKEMQNDIANLRDKVASYYAQNGKIPASIKYTNIDDIKSAGVISDAADTGDFLVIDLSALENLTLNYGKDFKNELTEENVNDYTDLYIINEASHNIFYVDGITVDNDTFYTDYTSEDIDKKSVDLRYVDGVKIPEGYSYVKGNKETGIVIKENDGDGKEYIWVIEEEKITQVPNDIEIDENKENEFLDSVNRFNGYYKSDSDNTVIYIEVTEKWSPQYDKEGIYKDKNGDTAYIPEGFQVSEKPGENTIDEGLVVKASDGSEFVWVPVDSSLRVAGVYGKEIATMTFGVDSNGRDNYQGKLYNFTGTGEVTVSTAIVDYGQGTTSYREPSLITGSENDKYASTTSIYGTLYDADSNFYSTILGYTSSSHINTGTMDFRKDMQNDYNEMVESVSKYGGFYIGRYETSIDGETVASKVGMTPMSGATDSGNTWYGMYKKQKEYASKNNLSSVKSSMIWGSQWDSVLNWILIGSDKEKVTATGNGNHSGKVMDTGATATDKMNNIYDLEGNRWEWTLEACSTEQRVCRGRRLQ